VSSIFLIRKKGWENHQSPIAMPDPLILATAAPMIGIFEDTAVPHNRVPSLNSTKRIMKVYLVKVNKGGDWGFPDWSPGL
jgi:hypothetical protein